MPLRDGHLKQGGPLSNDKPDPDLLTVPEVALRDVGTIEVGTAVVPIQTQHPMLLAQRALTISLISSGRLVLGLGGSHRPITEGMW